MELDIVELLICLVDQPRNVAIAMRALGYPQEQISEASRAASAPGFTESTRLGMDRITPAGRAWAAAPRAS